MTESRAVILWRWPPAGESHGIGRPLECPDPLELVPERVQFLFKVFHIEGKAHCRDRANLLKPSPLTPKSNWHMNCWY
jgi:hypothetical protein